jgi:hypothetical protein
VTAAHVEATAGARREGAVGDEEAREPSVATSLAEAEAARPDAGGTTNDEDVDSPEPHAAAHASDVSRSESRSGARIALDASASPWTRRAAARELLGCVLVA